MRYQLLVASLRGAKLGDICAGPLREGDGELRLGPFQSIRKARFYVDQERSFEADLHAVCEDGVDLILEVKAWEKGVSREVVLRFLEMKAALADQLERRTVFLFYSEHELAEELSTLLRDAGIVIIDATRLASYEATSPTSC